jgi:NTP pyrophosphatase (non-canonical NTP hydrolase)
MEFRKYQREARRTDQVPTNLGKGLIVPLLGLAGEVGTLLAEYKKHLRDGDAHRLFKEQIAEELGDLLWYVADVAGKFDLDLNKIASQNLAKTRERWALSNRSARSAKRLFDESFPRHEQIPRLFRIKFEQIRHNGRAKILLARNGQPVGNHLTDNAYYDDGYRFHDVFHLSYAGLLGWSPITRGVLGCKRRSKAVVDEVEDGGRAGVIEEGIAAFVYDYAKKHNYLKTIRAIDYRLLKTIKSLTSDLEVSRRTPVEWERAILEGYKVWRMLRANRGGVVTVNLAQRKIGYSRT